MVHLSVLRLQDVGIPVERIEGLYAKFCGEQFFGDSQEPRPFNHFSIPIGESLWTRKISTLNFE
jgi:hypothetical protein